MKVTIADYGIGNLHSVLKAMRAAGADVTVSADPALVRTADRVVLPGVGAFGVLAIPGGPGVKVPHVGWNRISPRDGGPGWDGTLLSGVATGTMVYFVHSFTAHPDREEDRLADAAYHGRRLSAAVQRDNIMGCQFHPEKSGELGLSLVRRFVSI